MTKKTEKANTSVIDADKAFSEIWNKACSDKRLDHIDRAIMQFIYKHPLASASEMARHFNMSRDGVISRIRRKDFMEMEAIFEGAFNVRMERIASKVTKRLEKMLYADFEHFLEECKRIAGSDLEPGQQAAAYRLLEKECDPEKAVSIAKLAMAFLAKQAELGLTKEAIDKGTLPSVQEARKILEGDLE